MNPLMIIILDTHRELLFQSIEQIFTTKPCQAHPAHVRSSETDSKVCVSSERVGATSLNSKNHAGDCIPAAALGVDEVTRHSWGVRDHPTQSLGDK